MTVSVLMVAEKPSICTSIAHALSDGGNMETRGRSPPVHEFHGAFMGQSAFIRVTSVTGHVFSTDFPVSYQDWDSVDPVDLFSAPVVHTPEGKGGIVKHLEREARGMDYLVLWLDCDREGENICFEVIKCVQSVMKQPQSYLGTPIRNQSVRNTYAQPSQTIFRARFSAVTPKDIDKAMRNLTSPNENESLAVDARQELDLKVGVAFSRFQTRYFQGKYGNLDSAIISYGPCQTPTLGFCVDRYDEIQSFKSKPYYCIDAVMEIRGHMLSLFHDKGRIFERNVCDQLVAQLSTEKELVCVDIYTKESRKSRPTPLNTVELLKLASRNLGIGPQATMRAAEHLYLSGYLSYPRTESTSYPSSFDFIEVLESQRAHPEWGGYSSHLLGKGYVQPRQGHDAGDHPPITPVGLALPHELHSSDNARIYELVVRHFLATISPDALFQVTKAQFSAPLTGERFTLHGKKETQAGFLNVYRTCVSGAQLHTVDGDELYSNNTSTNISSNSTSNNSSHYNNAKSNKPDTTSDEMPPQGLLELPPIEKGQAYRLVTVKFRQGATKPPGYLTESDLISRMEKHGIGTDASIPTHINNIIVRNYVTLGPGRTLVPTELGIVLVHGYQRIDPYLVLPDTRAAIEAACDRIAKGLQSKEQVLAAALASFKHKFEHFRQHIGCMDGLFEATFSPVATTAGKNMSKCGRCSRYMRFIPMRPQRLHCPTCKETYSLPQNGTIKLYKELKCPLDQFELVLFSLGNTAKAQGKSYPLCPCCYSQPPVFLSAEEVQRLEQGSGRGSDTAVGDGGNGGKSSEGSSASMQVSACAARAMRNATTSTTDVTDGRTKDSANVLDSLQCSIDDLSINNTTSGATTATGTTILTLNDVEDHKGVKIRRRVKVAAKSNYFDPSIDNSVPKNSDVSASTAAFADPLVALMNNELPSLLATHNIPSIHRTLHTTTSNSNSLPSLPLPPQSTVPVPVPVEPVRNPRRERSKVGAGSKVNWIKDTVSSTHKQGTATYSTVGGLSSETDVPNHNTTDVDVKMSTTTTTEVDSAIKINTNTTNEADIVPIAQRRDRSRPGSGGRVNRTLSTPINPTTTTNQHTKPEVTAPTASEINPATRVVATSNSDSSIGSLSKDKKIKEGNAVYNARDVRTRRQQNINKEDSENATSTAEKDMHNNGSRAVTNSTVADTTELMQPSENLEANVVNSAAIPPPVDAINTDNIINTTAITINTHIPNANYNTTDSTLASLLISPPPIPSLQAIEEVTEYMGCNSCLHPSCPHSATMNRICECPGDDNYGQPCTGSLILDVNSKPNWKLACNKMHCNTLIRFRSEIHDITPQPHIPCPVCGITTAIFEFNKLRSPLADGATTCVGCVLCDEFLNSITEVVAGRAKNLRLVRQERYKRGGMMGGRGRGRGRGGRGGRVRDVKMSFSEF